MPADDKAFLKANSGVVRDDLLPRMVFDAASEEAEGMDFILIMERRFICRYRRPCRNKR